jgi:hypothetical protein
MCSLEDMRITCHTGSVIEHPHSILFQIGGVVMRSPFIAIAAYEQKLGIPANYLNCSMSVVDLTPNGDMFNCINVISIYSVERGPSGAWQKFERGELPLFPFYEAFSRDLSDTVNGNVWYAAYCKRRCIGRTIAPELLTDYSRVLCSECPKLPKDLKIDGREVGFCFSWRDALFMSSSYLAR